MAGLWRAFITRFYGTFYGTVVSSKGIKEHFLKSQAGTLRNPWRRLSRQQSRMRAKVRLGFGVFCKSRPGKIAWPPLSHLLFLSLWRESVLLVELVYASTSIDKLLSTREKRMAVGADFNSKILLRGAGLVCRTTGTGDCCRMVLRMDSGLHENHLVSMRNIRHCALL